jgi:hypothetical protein
MHYPSLFRQRLLTFQFVCPFYTIRAQTFGKSSNTATRKAQDGRI